MRSRGKRAHESDSVQPSRRRVPAPFFVDTEDIVSGADLGYRPEIVNDVPNPYSREGMAQQMGLMDDTPMYEDADMEQLYSHPEADVGDSEPQGCDEEPHSGTTGATQDGQVEDPATRVLRDKEIRTISK
jgi:hypothetical protein